MGPSPPPTFFPLPPPTLKIHIHNFPPSNENAPTMRYARPSDFWLSNADIWCAVGWSRGGKLGGRLKIKSGVRVWVKRRGKGRGEGAGGREE